MFKNTFQVLDPLLLEACVVPGCCPTSKMFPLQLLLLLLGESALRAEAARVLLVKPAQRSKAVAEFLVVQSGFLSILYSIGSKPLQIWDKKGELLLLLLRMQVVLLAAHSRTLVKSLPDLSCRLAVENGHIKRITDGDIQSSVLEVASANVATTYITCPADPERTLGIKLPFLVMIIKNLNRYFSFEVQVLDDKNVRRRFRASNYQVRPCQAAGRDPQCLSSSYPGCVHALLCT